MQNILTVIKDNPKKSTVTYAIYQFDPTSREAYLESRIDQWNTRENVEQYWMGYWDRLFNENPNNKQLSSGTPHWQLDSPMFKKVWEGKSVVFKANIKPNRISWAEHNKRTQFVTDDGLELLMQADKVMRLLEKVLDGSVTVNNGYFEVELTFVKIGGFIGVEVYDETSN